MIHASSDGNLVRVEVADEGMGLADPERVFDAFYTTKERGMGMGLAISRSIIEMQGGQLWAESSARGGTKFVFNLSTAE